MRTMESINVEIIPFEDRYLKDFVGLNVEWLDHYFVVEDEDRELMGQARERIIDTDGQIFFARINEQIVGTVAMIDRGEKGYELAKMAVTPNFQGLKIGQKLLDACLDFGREKGLARIYLESNTVMVPAINLYRKNGFKEMKEYHDSPYQRSNIQMEVFL